MNILLTNDDGINALGIICLKNYLQELGHHVYLIAPNKERSCCGHGMSLGVEIEIHKIDDKTYSCSGLPADCVHLAIKRVFSEIKFDLTISGINHGANLGQDIYYSGTVAGARESSFLGIPSVAISICTSNVCEVSLKNIFPILTNDFFLRVKSDFEIGHVVNLNFPSIPNKAELEVIQSELSFRRYCNSIETLKSSENTIYYKIDGKYDGYFNFPYMTDSKAIENGFISRSLIKIF